MQNHVIFRFNDVTVKFSRVNSEQSWSVEIGRHDRQSANIRLYQGREPSIPSAFQVYSRWMADQTAEHAIVDC